jgi:hypothetical protein
MARCRRRLLGLRCKISSEREGRNGCKGWEGRMNVMIDGDHVLYLGGELCSAVSCLVRGCMQACILWKTSSSLIVEGNGCWRRMANWNHMS